MLVTPKKAVEVEGEGLVALLGEKVIIFCNVYIYVGTLIGVNDTCIKLDEDAAIVYETGPHGDTAFKDAQKLGNVHYVSTGLIESFGPTKKVW